MGRNDFLRHDSLLFRGPRESISKNCDFIFTIRHFPDTKSYILTILRRFSPIQILRHSAPIRSKAIEHPPSNRAIYPLAYSAHCKRNKSAGRTFLMDNVFDDLLLIQIAYVSVFAPSLFAILGITFLHFSLWCIYEAGYVENDRIAATTEADGSVPENFAQFSAAYSEPRAWIFAALLGVIGVVLITYSPFVRRGLGDLPLQKIVLGTVAWAVLLIAMRLTYWVYNNIDKMSRVYVYPALQAFKYGFPSLFLVLEPISAALLMAQILRRWIPYLIYRYTGIKRHNAPTRLIRLAAFLICAILLTDEFDHPEALWKLGLITFVLVLRANREIRTAMSRFSLVRHDKWKGDDNTEV